MPDKHSYEELEQMIQMFFQAFELITDAVFVYLLEEDGAPGRFIEVNQAACQRLEYAKDALLQRTPLEIGLIAPEFSYDEALNELSGKGAFRFEALLVSQEGRRLPVENHLCLFEKNGRRCVLSVSRDIGERMRSETALRESEARFRTIYENAPVMIDAFDENDRCVLWNRQCRETLGWTMDEVNASDDVLKKIYPDPVVRDQVMRTVSKADGSFRQWHPKTKDGKTLSTMWANFRLPDGIVIGLGYDITEQKQAADALRFNQKLLRDVMDIVPAYICAKDLHGRFILVNKKLADFYDTTVDAMTGWLHADLCENEEELKAMLAADREVIRNGQPKYIPEETMENADGSIFFLETYKIPFAASEGPAVLIVSADITDRRRAEEEREKLEAQFRQVQKLESVGRLAGGVAHDLNNLLTPIIGYGDMLLGEFDGNDDRKSSVEQIVHAGMRARDIVHQLLAFSRKQALEFKPVDLNKVLTRFEKLLRGTIREDIDIRLVPALQVPMIHGDIGQLEQVIMNLAVNAQDAMPQGGTLTFETYLTELDEDYAAVHDGVKPGAYVMLNICDTGCGMDTETRELIFEPFFSTKGDHGTGLGLATVYGIVKQHGGNIWVHSETGKGTTFKIYLPVFEEADVPTESDSAGSSQINGTETILIVEDNEQVRELSREILRRRGYNVLIAGDGKAALTTLARHPGALHLLLTDVVLPKMNGKDLFDRISVHHPDVKVLYMSGYTNDVVVHRGVLDEGVNFMQKPFSVQALAAKVRDVLDG